MTRSISIVLGLAAFVGTTTSSLAQNAATSAPGRQILIRSARANVDMVTTVLLPQGRGPFPLAVINHGTAESSDLREAYEKPTFAILASWLVQRGYVVVLPQRPGHGETGGPYLETAGGCENADYERAGYATADSIETAIHHMLAQPFVKKGRVLLTGHSAGAWGALALASRSPRLASAVISFAAGRGGRSYGVANRNCVPERLVSTAAIWGRRVTAPTLWLYSVNDTFFDSSLSRRMADAFRSGGAPTEYRLLPPFREDGHYFVFYDEAVPRWEPTVQRFLAAVK